MPRTGRVLLIYTGGTIGMGRNPATDALEPLDFNHLVQRMPELQAIPVGIDVYQFAEPIDSSDMSPRLWARIVEIIVGGYDRYDGRGKAKAIPVQTVAVGTSSITVKNATNKFKLEIDRATGIISGSLRVNYTLGGKSSYLDATWNGVLLTGWSSECDCSEGDAVQMPFICGALSFPDTVSYKDGGSTKKVEVLSGGRIYSGSAFPQN